MEKKILKAVKENLSKYDEIEVDVDDAGMLFVSKYQEGYGAIPVTEGICLISLVNQKKLIKELDRLDVYHCF